MNYCFNRNQRCIIVHLNSCDNIVQFSTLEFSIWFDWKWVSDIVFLTLRDNSRQHCNCCIMILWWYTILILFFSLSFSFVSVLHESLKCLSIILKGEFWKLVMLLKGWIDEDFLIFLETCCHWIRSDFQIKNIKCIRFLVSVGTAWLSGCLSTKIANMICWMHWINIPASVYYMKAFIWPNVPEICTSFCLIRCWESRRYLFWFVLLNSLWICLLW